MNAVAKHPPLRNSRAGLRAWFVLAATLVAAPLAASPIELTPRPTEDERLLLLYEAKLDAADFELGLMQSHGSSLIIHAELAQRAGRTADALGYYEAYLRWFPFGVMDWYEQIQRDWSRAAINYLELRSESEQPDALWFQQSLAAVPSYKELLQAYADRNFQKYSDLTDHIIANYPHSIFCQPAVLTTYSGRVINFHTGLREGPQLLASFFDKLIATGVAERDCLLLVLYYKQRVRQPRAADDQTLPLLSAVDIADWTDNPFIRRAYFADEIRELLKAGDKQAAREHGRMFLDTYADDWRAKGRTKLIADYLALHAHGEALYWIGQWKQSGESQQIAAAMLLVGQQYARDKFWNEAIRTFDDVIQASPAGSATSVSAKFGQALAYGALKDEAKMIQLLQDVALQPAVDTHSNIMDASNTRNYAYEILAEHHMKKGNWQEALLWWQRWRPSSWCGNCAQELQKKRADKIKACQLYLTVHWQPVDG